VIAVLGKAKVKDAVPLVRDRLSSPMAPVRAASATALGQIGRAEGVLPALRTRINDADVEVRKAAITALGALEGRESLPALLAAVDREDVWFEASMALAAVPDVRALQIYLRGLGQPNPDLRKAASAAVAAIRDEAAPSLERLAQRRELPTTVLPELRKVYTSN